MHRAEKILDLRDSVQKLAGMWVEMKIYGLKIGEILDSSTY